MRALSVLLLAVSLPAFPQVKVWQGTLTLPTYQEGMPDVNPPFDVFATTKYDYPYTVRDKLTGKSVEQKWRALFLENEYLKCSVLPDIGGHLYSCTDKVNGQEMFYANPSIKKALIGYRGAWAAFGIEFNFPVSHNWVSMSPVDFATEKHADGSASVWVANIDRVYGMQWRVELILRPGSTVLEEYVRLYNRSDVRHRFYWWNNAGVQVYDDSHVVYPMRWTASHGFTMVDTWPVNRQGLDVSIIKNQTRGTVSQFIHGSREPFMGVWHPKTNAGTIHFAYWNELPGKKIWSWGADAAGREWRNVLSDNNSAYVEVQAGPFRNQETYAFLPPQETLEFHEYWMPVRGIGGYSRATLDAVVNMQREGGTTLNVGMNVNHTVSGTLRLKDGDRTMAEEKVKLTPKDTWKKAFPGLDAAKKYTVELRNDAGRVEIAHTEDKYDWDNPADIQVGPQQAKRFPPAAKRSDGDFLEIGTNAELDGKLIVAWETYQQGLEKYPESLGLNKAKGRLAVGLNRFPEAVDPLMKALKLVSNDAEAHYYLGLAYNALGQSRKARGEWERAQLFSAFRSPATLELARLDAREGDRGSALREIRGIVSEFPHMVRAGVMEVALLRHANQAEAAKGRLDYWLREDPTSYTLRFEKIKLGGADAALWNHLAADAYRVLNMAEDYMELGFYGDALELLGREYPRFDAAEGEPGSVVPQQNPLVAYYRAYCKQLAGQPAGGDFAAASKLSTRYVFPQGAGTFAVLKKAVEVNPQDATAHFLLGSVYEAGGMVDEAMREWQSARSINRDIPVLHRNMAYTLLLLKNQPEQALEVFREGLDADRNNLEIYTGMNLALTLLGRPASERVTALEKYPDPKTMPANLVYALALALAQDGRGAEAEKLFQGRFFPREEGGISSDQVLAEVKLQKAIATGQGVDEVKAAGRGGADARLEYYLGVAEAKAGNQDAARQHWKRAVELGQGGGGQGFGRRGGGGGGLVFAYRAAVKLGETAGWQQRLENALNQMGPENDDAMGGQWYMRGLLLQALGRDQEAQAALRHAVMAPDRMLSRHMASLALQGK